MTEQRKEELRAAIETALRNDFRCEEILDEENNFKGFAYEVFADREDRFSDKTILQIIESDDPTQKFNESMDEYYEEYLDQCYEEFVAESAEEFEKEHGIISDEERESIEDMVHEMVSVSLPSEHFIDQHIKADIFIDTGDGNYDYVLNHTYPAYDGSEKIDPRASLVWLGLNQGYKYDELAKALDEGDISEPEDFLGSVRQEVANETSHMNQLVFLVDMPLSKMIGIARLVKNAEKTGHEFEPWKRPDRGGVTVSKETVCGLFDEWNGAGSLLEIKLEKDCRIPARFIKTVVPDTKVSGYSVESVYGLDDNCWKDSIVR